MRSGCGQSTPSFRAHRPSVLQTARCSAGTDDASPSCADRPPASGRCLPHDGSAMQSRFRPDIWSSAGHTRFRSAFPRIPVPFRQIRGAAGYALPACYSRLPSDNPLHPENDIPHTLLKSQAPSYRFLLQHRLALPGPERQSF